MLKRKKYDEIWLHLPKKEHTIIIGPRQTGKSTLLRQLADELKAGPEPVMLFNLERRDILQELNADPENIFKFLPRQQTGRCIALIDEVQYLNDPANFLKLLFDEHSDKLKVVATGSSAFYIDRQFKDSLAGRKRIFELLTLDFEEFLLFTGLGEAADDLQKLRDGSIGKTLHEAQLWRSLEQYLIYGSYPGVALLGEPSDKIELLHEIRDSFVKRDILESGVDDEFRFYNLMALLAHQSGSLVNANELANTLKMGHATVEKYLYVLQKCFHISLVRPFFANLRKELTKMPKVYYNDLGLRNAMLNNFSPLDNRADKGVLIENLVFRALHSKHPLQNLHFWRTGDGEEVDFVVEESYGQGFAVEVKYDSSEAKPRKYQKFVEAYPTFPLQYVGWRGGNLLTML